MGLAASQGRMLLLTARKSDLEFRAQQISQRRLDLSRQLESISTEYERACNNRQMKLNMTSGSGSVYKNLTYHNLVSGSIKNGYLGSAAFQSAMESEAYCNANYRLVNSKGDIVIPSAEYLPDYKSGTLDNVKDKTNTITVQDDSGSTTTVSYKRVGNNRFQKLPDGATYFIDPNIGKTTGTDNDGKSTQINYLQDCLRNGIYLIQQGKTTVTDDGDTVETEWSGLSWDATTDIEDEYYSKDDDVAKAKYDRLQRQIQNQDKKLELELDQVETQRSAVKTEIESVKKIISENIESTFNYTS